ncbi:MAG TPA: peptide chain release factor N(5)-glutamine methyltransferase [Bacteroidales bacterium]|nr:peptide chain release factor N(5)-glutamine methyltransferase [Bacteroidales bacterium]
MTQYKELKDRSIELLKAIYPERESRAIINRVFSDILGIDPLKAVVDPDMPVEPEKEILLMNCTRDLLSYKPLQYVTGKAYFLDLQLDVRPGVLIPRPETEELVSWIIRDQASAGPVSILDIGTGSGCIVLALGKRLPGAKLTALDISPAALEIARANAMKHAIPVSFIEIDIMDEGAWKHLGPFDVIVSNPPYVRESEKSLMQPNVLDYEPAVALFVGDDDPLVFYRKVSDLAHQHLFKTGFLYFEINEYLGDEVVRLLRNSFSEVILKQDLHGKNRFIRAAGLL